MPERRTHRDRPPPRPHRWALPLLALTATLTIGPAAFADAVDAIWVPSFEHTDGLKISLVSSEGINSPTDRVRACFVLSNTNTPPGGIGIPPCPPHGAPCAYAEIEIEDTVGSGLPFEFYGVGVEEGVGGVPVSCSLESATVARMTPDPMGAPPPGSIANATVTNKCCFTAAAPAAPGGALLDRSLAYRLFSGASSCDPAYPECIPGQGDEVLYTLQTNSGSETVDLYIWTLGGPGCGLIGLEALAVPVLARWIRGARRRGRRAADRSASQEER